MNGITTVARLDRSTGLMRRSPARAARPMLSRELMDWVPTPHRIPSPEWADYEYRLGSHELILAIHGMTERQGAAVGRDEAEFALVVEGPLLVFGSRFGVTLPWSWAAPYNWHFAPPAERVVPAAIPLSPETYARLWATLWITLVDATRGRAHIGRAVALRPEFTHALHGVLREQAMRPFPVAAAERALDRLQHAACPLELRARVRSRCAAVSDHGGRRAPTRAVQDDAAQDIPLRKPMSHDPGTSIVITEGYWMHIPHTRIHHRRYPEARGEGRSLAGAASHLMNQLTRGLDFVHGREREAVEQVLADVRSFRSSRPRRWKAAIAPIR